VRSCHGQRATGREASGSLHTDDGYSHVGSQGEMSSSSVRRISGSQGCVGHRPLYP